MTRSLTLMTIVLFGASGCGARTGPRDGIEVDSGVDSSPEVVVVPPTVSCNPAEAWTTIDRPSVVSGEAGDDGWIASWAWELVEGPSGSMAEPVPSEADVTSLTPDREGDYELRLTVTDDQGQTATCEALIHSVIGPPVVFCPDDIIGASVGRTYSLEGDAFDDEMILSFRWEVTERPTTSRAQPIPDNQPTTSFTPDEAGVFVLTFTATDNESQSTSCDVTITSSGPPRAICPDDAIVPTRQPHLVRGDAEDDGVIEVWSWEIIESPPSSSATLTSPNSQSPTLTPDRVGRYILRLTITDDTGLTDSCETVIDATPTAPDAICPDTIRTTPLTEVTLRGDGEDDGRIVGWDWILVETPPGSSAPPPYPPDEQTTLFMPDVAGEYTIRLVVFDDDGMEGSCSTRVIAIPGEGFRVELYWNPPDSSCDSYPGDPPECDPTDVDLHLLHPDADRWFDYTAGMDCFYANCIGGLEWDSGGPVDNPRLDLDDVEGFGPENINIDEPVIGHLYTVGVHFYSDDLTGMQASAYIRIYCGTIEVDPVYEVGPVDLEAHGGSSQNNDFWRVATVVWDGYLCTVDPLIGADGGPDIITANDAEGSR